MPICKQFITLITWTFLWILYAAEVYVSVHLLLLKCVYVQKKIKTGSFLLVKITRAIVFLCRPVHIVNRIVTAFSTYQITLPINEVELASYVRVFIWMGACSCKVAYVLVSCTYICVSRLLVCLFVMYVCVRASLCKSRCTVYTVQCYSRCTLESVENRCAACVCIRYYYDLRWAYMWLLVSLVSLYRIPPLIVNRYSYFCTNAKAHFLPCI